MRACLSQGPLHWSSRGRREAPWNLDRIVDSLTTRSLLGGIMGSDAAGQYFAHRQLVFFSTHWKMWISAQRRLRKSLQGPLSTRKLAIFVGTLGQTSFSGVLSSFPSSIALSSRMTVAYSRGAKFKVMVRCRVQAQAWPHFFWVRTEAS